VTDCDFVGYGQQAPPALWPNGKKLVVSLVVNHEEGAEKSLAAHAWGELERDATGVGWPAAQPRERARNPELTRSAHHRARSGQRGGRCSYDPRDDVCGPRMRKLRIERTRSNSPKATRSLSRLCQ
jgi:hypothetical protein